MLRTKKWQSNFGVGPTLWTCALKSKNHNLSKPNGNLNTGFYPIFSLIMACSRLPLVLGGLVVLGGTTKHRSVARARAQTARARWRHSSLNFIPARLVRHVRADWFFLSSVTLSPNIDSPSPGRCIAWALLGLPSDNHVNVINYVRLILELSIEESSLIFNHFSAAILSSIFTDGALNIIQRSQNCV